MPVSAIDRSRRDISLVEQYPGCLELQLRGRKLRPLTLCVTLSLSLSLFPSPPPSLSLTVSLTRNPPRVSGGNTVSIGNGSINSHEKTESTNLRFEIDLERPL